MNGQLALDAQALYQDLLRGVRQLCAQPLAGAALAGPPASGATPQLVGIRSGGAWLAQRLHADLGRSGQPGVISSALHRDDFAKRGLSTGAGHTELPFDINDADLLLIDDVLYTGRTIRAVLNELFDYGRPARVRLAVLVDRGGRQLPVQADYAAARISLPPSQSLALALALAQGQDNVLSFQIKDKTAAANQAA